MSRFQRPVLIAFMALVCALIAVVAGLLTLRATGRQPGEPEIGMEVR